MACRIGEEHGRALKGEHCEVGMAVEEYWMDEAGE